MPSTLDKIIKEKGISLYRLAKLTGIPYSTLHALKSSQEKLTACSGRTLYELSQTLNVPIERFFEGWLYVPHRFADAFWDSDMGSFTEEDIPFVISRIEELGGIDGICYVEKHFTKEQNIEAAKTQQFFSPVTANYLAQQFNLKKEDMAYYRLGGYRDWLKNQKRIQKMKKMPTK
jgi:transcriptional regulator with XRE-family HTH domain